MDCIHTWVQIYNNINDLSHLGTLALAKPTKIHSQLLKQRIVRNHDIAIRICRHNLIAYLFALKVSHFKLGIFQPTKMIRGGKDQKKIIY